MLYLGKDRKGELSSPEEKEVTIFFFSDVDFPKLVKHWHIPVQGFTRVEFSARSSSELAVAGLAGPKPIPELEVCEQNQRGFRYLF